jgi:hypothetical protein
MKNAIFLPCLFCVLFFAQCQQSSSKGDKSPESIAIAPKPDLVERGAYLVGICGCNDCHSPKRMGANGPEVISELMLSGYPGSQPVPPFDTKMTKMGFAMFTPDLTAAYGPWGTSFAANLTPDDTGLGNWTLDHFKKALKEGKAKGLDNGRMLLPPMPWFNYTRMSDDDVSAMFAYLQSIPAVKNVVPVPVPPMQ